MTRNNCSRLIGPEENFSNNNTLKSCLCSPSIVSGDTQCGLLDEKLSTSQPLSKTVITGSTGCALDLRLCYNGVLDNEVSGTEGYLHVRTDSESTDLAGDLPEHGGQASIIEKSITIGTDTKTALSVNDIFVHKTGSLVETIDGNKTFQNDVTIQGNLCVLGTCVINNVECLTVEDPLVTVNSDGSETAGDRYGIEVCRATSGNVALWFCENAGQHTWYACADPDGDGSYDEYCIVLKDPATGSLEADHNLLQGLQGGSTTERYHLTQSEHDTLTTGLNADLLHRHCINNIQGVSISSPSDYHLLFYNSTSSSWENSILVLSCSTDVDDSARGTSNKFLCFDSVNSCWIASTLNLDEPGITGILCPDLGGTGSSSLSYSSSITDEIIIWNGSSLIGSGCSLNALATQIQVLNDLQDVTINSPSDGQLLCYSSGQWVNWTHNFATTDDIQNYVLKAGDVMTGSLAISGVSDSRPNLVIGGGSSRIGANGPALEICSGTSSMVLSTQDGNGRIQMKWNATYGINERYLVSSEAAGKWQFDPSNYTTELFTVEYAPAGTAGNTISWQQILNVGTDVFTYKGDDVLTESNFTNYLDGRYVLKTGDVMTGTLGIDDGANTSDTIGVCVYNGSYFSRLLYCEMMNYYDSSNFLQTKYNLISMYSGGTQRVKIDPTGYYYSYTTYLGNNLTLSSTTGTTLLATCNMFCMCWCDGSTCNVRIFLCSCPTTRLFTMVKECLSGTCCCVFIMDPNNKCLVYSDGTVHCSVGYQLPAAYYAFFAPNYVDGNVLRVCNTGTNVTIYPESLSSLASEPEFADRFVDVTGDTMTGRLNLNGSVPLLIKSTTPRTAVNYGIEWYGPTSSMILSVQDGNGRIQMKWNASAGVSEQYLVSNEPAGRWQFDTSVSECELFTVEYAPAGNAGDTIYWIDILKVGGACFTYLGSPVLTASNYPTYVDDRYVNVTGDTMTGGLCIFCSSASCLCLYGSYRRVDLTSITSTTTALCSYNLLRHSITGSYGYDIFGFADYCFVNGSLTSTAFSFLGAEYLIIRDYYGICRSGFSSKEVFYCLYNAAGEQDFVTNMFLRSDAAGDILCNSLKFVNCHCPNGVQSDGYSYIMFMNDYITYVSSSSISCSEIDWVPRTTSDPIYFQNKATISHDGYDYRCSTCIENYCCCTLIYYSATALEYVCHCNFCGYKTHVSKVTDNDIYIAVNSCFWNCSDYVLCSISYGFAYCYCTTAYYEEFLRYTELSNFDGVRLVSCINNLDQSYITCKCSVYCAPTYAHYFCMIYCLYCNKGGARLLNVPQYVESDYICTSDQNWFGITNTLEIYNSIRVCGDYYCDGVCLCTVDDFRCISLTFKLKESPLDLSGMCDGVYLELDGELISKGRVIPLGYNSIWKCGCPASTTYDGLVVCYCSDGTNFTFELTDVIKASVVQSTYADIAEYYISNEEIDPGYFVAINKNVCGISEVCKAFDSCDYVIGVVSDSAGFILRQEIKDDPNTILVGLKGLVYAYVKGPVSKGENLMIWKDGIAKRFEDGNQVIGTVLENIEDDSVKRVKVIV